MDERRRPDVILYDGVCGLCHRFVRFVLRHDRGGTFCFASLQSPVAHVLLERHGRAAGALDTVYVVVDVDTAAERLLDRSAAVLHVLQRLGGVWAVAARAVRGVPRLLRDASYGVIGRHRYRVFGRHDACPLPDPAARARFLDGGAPG